MQSFYCRRARDEGIPSGRGGAVVCTQRFDAAIRLNVHFHALLLDGVYTGFGAGESLAFHQATRLHDEEIVDLVRHIEALITGHLRRQGFLDPEGNLPSEAGEDLDTLGTCHAAAVQGVIPFGPRTGQAIRLWGDAETATHTSTSRPPKKLCADLRGYSLHAAVRIAACNTHRLERIARYVTRGPIAKDRLSLTASGDIVYRFRTPWRNGKQAVVMDPMTFLARLAAQIPPRRFHVLSYYGVLAAAAARRDDIVPQPKETDVDPHRCQPRNAAKSKPKPEIPRRRRIPWSDLLQRVFLIDVLKCPCGARRRVLSMICSPASIQRTLSHLGLPTEFPARSPPRLVDRGLPFAHSP